jgi:molybdopterin-containing oxidoreductase family iron-sulfur binding subunit
MMRDIMFRHCPMHTRDSEMPVETATAQRYWRGLEELCATPEFRAYVEREFPEQASQWTDPVTRRQFLMLMGASFALAGIAGCSPRPAPAEKIMPYVRQPEGMIPGKPMSYATAMTLGGASLGLIVESHEGRPTKVEGNPQHPASLGATDMFAQASILGLYDPDRSKSVTYHGRPRAWSEFVQQFQSAIAEQRKRRGSGLRILTESVVSPTLASQLESLLADKELAEAKWCQFEPTANDAAYEGARQAFGEPVNALYHFVDADVVLALDADFLACGPAHVRHVREFANRRRVRFAEGKPDQASMNRLYVVEPVLTPTGATADHRLPLAARRIGELARAVAVELSVSGVVQAVGLDERERKWATAVARDLRGHAGRSVILAGEGQPASVHALVHAMNAGLGNHGKTITFTRPVAARPVHHLKQIQELTTDLESGQVELLVILGANPAYTAPADLNFAERLRKMPAGSRVHLGQYQDETAVLCDWHIPEAHYLESWSDTRAFDGTASIVQPLITPLYNGRSAHELLGLFAESNSQLPLEIVRDYWRERRKGGDFEAFWRRSLREGVVPDSAFAKQTVSLREDWHKQTEGSLPSVGMEINFRADPTLYDGRFANNGWLQELPKPILRLTWDNAAILSPKTAKERFGLSQSFGPHGGERGESVVNMVELRYRGATLKLPAWILPGCADDSVTVHLGHGRTRAGHVGTGAGFNAYQLRTSSAPWFDTGLGVQKLVETFTLASVQMHHSMESRAPVRTATLDEFKRNPGFAKTHEEAGERINDDRRLHPLTMYPQKPYDGYKWGILIDLTTCVGCSACVVACQSENNIPVVGKTEVTRGREMHWLRIDRYFSGPPHDPQTHFQPVPCMHCENAPCELVCPVNATVHSDDGLNDMVYNRCVGTRYCSNNCPYKVRRFNFLQYSDYATESLKLMHNPQVTVRSRGVMEKCTYCVQRIRSAEITAEREGRRIHDGEIQTACQQACPAQAIIFGDLNDPKSRVLLGKKEPHEYGLLAELNTVPRTTYLAQIKNPNPEVP